MKATLVIALHLSIVTAVFNTCRNHTTATTAKVFPERANNDKISAAGIKTGAEQTAQYVPYLKNKRVGMVVNPTSVIGNETVVDSLLKVGIKITKIFGPEHGFRGDASAGIAVDDAVDAKTGIKAISLYGKHEKPTAEDLADLDIVVFDIQDVGVRFYTYINTLQRVMEACAENNKEVLILDRPNPNGFYIDGPILDPKLRSGIGMQPIPVEKAIGRGQSHPHSQIPGNPAFQAGG